MENMFMELMYNKEFNNKTLKDKIRNHRAYRSMMKKIKKNPPNFSMLWDFSEFLRDIDSVYGFTSDVDDFTTIAKTKNERKYNDYDEVILTRFGIHPKDRITIFFTLDKESHKINIMVDRDKTANIDWSRSEITFIADETVYLNSDVEKMIINQVNKELQKFMMYYLEKIYKGWF